MAFQDLFAAWEKAGPILRPKPLEYPWPLECTSALSEGALSCAPACARVCRSRMYRRDVAARAMGLRRAGDDARRLRAQVSRSSLCCQSPRATGPARPVSAPHRAATLAALAPRSVESLGAETGLESVQVRAPGRATGEDAERPAGVWRRRPLSQSPTVCACAAGEGSVCWHIYHVCRTHVSCVSDTRAHLSCVSDTRAHLPGALTPGHI